MPSRSSSERHEIEGLVSDNEPHKPPLTTRCIFREGEKRQCSMWIQIKVIWGAVVLVVLSHPPGPAQANQETNAEADDCVPSDGAADRPMPSIMAYVPNLAEDKGQERRIHQLEPEIVYYHQEDNTQDQHDQRQENFRSVIGGLFIEQPSLFNKPP